VPTPTLLITGGSGYLGSQLLRRTKAWITHATYFQTTPTTAPRVTFHQCDLRETQQVHNLLTEIRPSVIIHTACSNQNQDNLESILPAARHLSEAAKDIKARFIHVSTDLVFDGKHGPYSEEAIPTPLSEYGRAKTQAEEVVKITIKNSLIVRPSLIYGLDPFDHQTRWLMQGIEDNQPVRLFTDEFRSPIWVHTLCQALLELAEGTMTGILHLGGTQAVNRWEFGQAMLKMLNRETPPNVIPFTIKESGMIRPENLTLKIAKAQTLLKTPLLSVEEVTQKLCHSR
jgi:dTDP-4-dehydrorhamnose reductase